MFETPGATGCRGRRDAEGGVPYGMGLFENRRGNMLKGGKGRENGRFF